MTQENNTPTQESTEIIPEVKEAINEWLNINIPVVTVENEEEEEEDLPF